MIDIMEKDLTRLATIHTESKTKYFLQVNSIDDLNESVAFARKNTLEIVIIGKGTNILFTKRKYTDKLFIKLGKGFDGFKISDGIAEIGGAYPFMRAGKKLTEMGYKDFIYMSLIPGSLGGGVRQNAGTTKEGEVKDNFISAKIYDLKSEQVIELCKDDMCFSYRNSILQEERNRYIVLSASFSLGDQDKNIDELKSLVQGLREKKKNKEPIGYCFGSTFKSIQYEKPVWWYIEQVGMRGKTIGEAKFSEKHSNWIINENNSQAADIMALIKEAKEKVLDKFKIDLQIEVELI